MTIRQKDRLLGAVSILITSCIIFLITSFFNSFASKAEVGILASTLSRIEASVLEMRNDIKQLIGTKKP